MVEVGAEGVEQYLVEVLLELRLGFVERLETLEDGLLDSLDRLEHLAVDEDVKVRLQTARLFSVLLLYYFEVFLPVDELVETEVDFLDFFVAVELLEDLEVPYHDCETAETLLEHFPEGFQLRVIQSALVVDHLVEVALLVR